VLAHSCSASAGHAHLSPWHVVQRRARARSRRQPSKRARCGPSARAAVERCGGATRAGGDAGGGGRARRRARPRCVYGYRLLRARHVRRRRPGVSRGPRCAAAAGAPPPPRCRPPRSPRSPRASPGTLGRAARRGSITPRPHSGSTQRVVRGLLSKLYYSNIFSVCPTSCALLTRSRSCLPAVLGRQRSCRAPGSSIWPDDPRPRRLCETAAGRCAGVSAALFAPGWVAEAAPAPAAWPAAAERLWGALADARDAPRPLAASLPFATSFDQGAGARMYLQARPRMARVEFGAARGPWATERQSTRVTASLSVYNQVRMEAPRPYCECDAGGCKWL